jgi:hypothetical protein
MAFQHIRLSFTLDTGASDEQLASLRLLTERHRGVHQLLDLPPAPAVTRKRAASRRQRPGRMPK